MYFWIGINLKDQLTEIKSLCKNLEKQLDFPFSCHELPAHISLKITFEINENDYEPILNFTVDYLENVKPFTVLTDKIEFVNGVVWIKMKECKQIKKLHEELDEKLLEKFGVKKHPFDLDFIFHSTLFLCEDNQKLSKAFDLVKECKIPPCLSVNSFVIGRAENLEDNDFKVVKTIDI